VTADGCGVVSRVGAALLRMLADRTGQTGALSGAVARRDWWPGHDRGRVLVDLSVMIADGGQAIGDIDLLRHQDALFGAVASPATCWRAVSSATCALRDVAIGEQRCGQSTKIANRHAPPALSSQAPCSSRNTATSFATIAGSAIER